MKLRPANRTAIGKEQQYATPGDFSLLFTEERTSLYLLSFLLTADSVTAWRCFVDGLGDSIHANSVFKQWAHAWARRMIIENAIRIIVPRPGQSGGTELALDPELSNEVQTALDGDAVIAPVFELPDFERFVFVMSVLEGYSDQECSALLRCSLQEFRNSRTQALQWITQSRAKSVASGCAALIH